ncbi:MAG: metal-dependent hydrolase [Acidobacteriota bacterium]
MDNLTHTLFALTLARTRLGRQGHGATAALVLASNAPDRDIVTAVGGGANYLALHRGPTHGPIGVLGLGLAAAVAVWAYGRRSARTPPGPTDDAHPRASFAALLLLSVLGVSAHILMDMPTSYGTRLLSPFNWQWFSVDWMPIVDAYLLAVLGASLLFRRHSPAARRRQASIALLMMVGDYGLRAAAHHTAISRARDLFAATPACVPAPASAIMEVWPLPPAEHSEPRGERPSCLVDVAALPTLVSPFRWRIVVRRSNAYQIQELNLLARASDRATTPVAEWPNEWSPAVFRAAATPAGRAFLGFARFPDARVLPPSDGMTAVVLSDMRFAPGLWSVHGPTPTADRLAVTIRVEAYSPRGP